MGKTAPPVKPHSDRWIVELPIRYNSETHQHRTRIQTNIHVGRTVHEYAKKCIRYNLPILVNNTTREILCKIDTHSLRSFAGYIKQYYMNSYQVNCTIPQCYICNKNLKLKQKVKLPVNNYPPPQKKLKL